MQTSSQNTFATAFISQQAASALLEATVQQAERLGIEVAVAITDAGGHLGAFTRTDKAPFLTATIALDKAWTAASYGIPTHVMNTFLDDPKVKQLGNHPRLMPVAGGYSIVDADIVVGGIGISGGNGAQDQEACEKALQGLGFKSQRQ